VNAPYGVERELGDIARERRHFLKRGNCKTEDVDGILARALCG
jgi:hypothetical protein